MARALLLAMLIQPSFQIRVNDNIWNMTRSFIDHFHAKDLAFYFYDSDRPGTDIVNLAYKDLSHDFQIAMVNINNKAKVQPKGPQVALVKFIQTTGDQDQLDKIVSLSSVEKWTYVNVWLLGITDVKFGRNETDYGALDYVRDICDQLDLEYMSQVYIYVQVEDKYVIYEAYKISKGDSEAEVLYFGYWTEEDGLIVTDSNIWHRRANLKGKHLRVSALLNKPYETMVVDGCQSPDCFQGMFADVFHELMDMMNFTYTMMMPKDGQWGAQRDNGSWTGVIGQLVEGEVDVSAADFRITASRIDVVNFLPTLDDPHMRLFIANPADSFNWYAYLRPYPMLTWTVIILILFISPPVVSTLITLGGSESKKDFSIIQCYGFVSGTIAIRDWQPAPNRLHSRIVFFTVLVFGLLIYYHWEAMIISYLAIRTTLLPFNSLEEMLTETDYKIVVQYGTAYVDSFRYSTNPLYQRAWKERMEPYVDTFPLTKDGMTEYIHSDTSFAMMDNYNTRIHYEDYISCKTVDIPKEYFQIQYAMPIAKDMPYFEAMWFHTNNLKERGTLMQIKDRYRNEPQVCPNLSGKPLGFNQTFTAFLIFIWGFVAAAILFGLEFLCRPRWLDEAKSSKALLSGWTRKGRVGSLIPGRSLQDQVFKNEEVIKRLQKDNQEIRHRLRFEEED